VVTATATTAQLLISMRYQNMLALLASDDMTDAAPQE